MIGKIKKNKTISAVLKGYVISIILSMIFIWIYAVLLVKTNIQETTIPVVIITISGISVLIGSTIGSFNVKKNGILNGSIVGLMYFLSLYVLSSIAVCGFGFNIKSIIMVLVGVVLGGLGGIIGVNISK